MSIDTMTAIDEDGFEDRTNSIRIVPGLTIKLAKASTIQLRSAIWFAESGWQLQPDDPHCWILCKMLDGYAYSVFARVDAMKAALAERGGDMTEPVIEVYGGDFIELRKADIKRLGDALREIEHPTPDKELSPACYLMRLPFADCRVKDMATVKARLIELVGAARSDIERLRVATEHAIKAASAAYQFSAGGYSFDAMNDALALRDLVTAIAAHMESTLPDKDSPALTINTDAVAA
jgi:hypothetical protein